MTDDRTVLPNGPILRALRKARAWTQEDLEYATRLAVEKLAAAEQAEGIKDGPITRYVERRQKQGRPLGIPRGTISSAERGERKYLTTLLILAATLEVPPSRIMILEDATAA